MKTSTFASRIGMGERGSIPSNLGPYLARSDDAAHGESAQGVWREALRRNALLTRQHAKRLHPAYVDGVNQLALTARIPRQDELNARLEPTGWRVVPVAGYIPAAEYAGLMAERVFPVSRVMRRREHIDFAPRPDLVHDVLGHLPMLFMPEFRAYLGQLATVMVMAVPNALDQRYHDAVSRLGELKSQAAPPVDALAAAQTEVERVTLALTGSASEVTTLRRMYIWSVEFGLLGDPGDFRVHGAALLSAPGELRAALAHGARTAAYSLAVLRRENPFSELLPEYFVARDFSSYAGVLAEYEATMEHRRARSGKPHA